MGALRRFAATLAISTALHAGAGFGIAKLVQHIREPLQQQVLYENIKRPKPEKKKPDLEKLKEERRKYVSEIYDSLMRGEEIKISDFLIKSEVLERNIEFAEKEEFGFDEYLIKTEYAALVRKAKKEVDLEENRVHALHRFVHTQVFKGYFWRSDSIDEVVDRGWYNCLSSTQLFSALLEDVLGEKEYQILVFDDHIATFLNGRKIENTEHVWKDANSGYNKCGLPVHRDAFVAAYLVKNGISPDELPAYLASIYSTKKDWRGCPKKGKKIVENIVGSSGFPTPGVKSGMSVPSYFMPNPYYETKTEEIVKLAEGLLVAYKFAHIHDEGEFLDVEVNGNKMKINPIVIPEDVDWGEVMERFKDLFSLSHIMPFVEEKERCCLPTYSIPPETVVKIIEGLPETENEKFKDYKREIICERYRRAIESGTEDELREYLDYPFCTELDDLLKQRYYEERKVNILWSGIGDMKNPENFDFFLNELKSGDDDVKTSAIVGLLLLDKEKACKITEGLTEEDRKILLTELMWGCKDKKLAWSIIEEWWEGKGKEHEFNSALSTLNGGDIDEYQYGFLKKIVGELSSHSKMETARILYEWGDKENALKYAEEAIEMAMRDEEINSPRICALPKGFMPVILPLLTDPEESTSVAQGLFCNEEHKEHLPEITSSLRKIVSDDEREFFDRIRAAFILLKMGIDPVEKKKK